MRREVENLIHKNNEAKVKRIWLVFWDPEIASSSSMGFYDHFFLINRPQNGWTFSL